jgi:nicotinamide mononucleotide transporter
MIAFFQNFLSIENIAFTLIGYPMSYVEFLGTLLTLWSVWLLAKRQILTWPVGLVSSLFYMVLFYQIKLYSDAIEQVYYLGTGVYGWWAWKQSSPGKGQVLGVRYSDRKTIVLWIVMTLLVAAIAGFSMSRIHLFLPVLFPEAASFPYLDALTTIVSFSGMLLMIQKKIECWIYWIVVDVIGIGLYFAKEVKFIALLYLVLLILASNGLRLWQQSDRIHPEAREQSAL